MRARLPLPVNEQMNDQCGEDHGAAEQGSPGRDFIVDEPNPDGAEDWLNGSDEGRKGGRDEPHASCEHGKAQAKIEGAKGNEPAEIGGAYQIMAREKA